MFTCHHNLIDSKTGKFYQFCRDWQIDRQAIQFDSDHILVADDINQKTTGKPNSAQCEPLVNLILHILRQLTQNPNTILHCSLAGGRKTMSVYFAYALQFFGRQQDKLYHVLTHPQEFQNHPDFYYLSPQPEILNMPDGKKLSTKLAQIELLEVPYIRLRNKMEYLFGDKNLPFDEMVRLTQTELEQMPNLLPLVVESHKKQITIGNKKIIFPLSKWHSTITMPNEAKTAVTRRQLKIMKIILNEPKVNGFRRNHWTKYFPITKKCIRSITVGTTII